MGVTCEAGSRDSLPAPAGHPAEALGHLARERATPLLIISAVVVVAPVGRCRRTLPNVPAPASLVAYSSVLPGPSSKRHATASWGPLAVVKGLEWPRRTAIPGVARRRRPEGHLVMDPPACAQIGAQAQPTLIFVSLARRRFFLRLGAPCRVKPDRRHYIHIRAWVEFAVKRTSGDPLDRHPIASLKPAPDDVSAMMMGSPFCTAVSQTTHTVCPIRLSASPCGPLLSVRSRRKASDKRQDQFPQHWV